MKKILVVLIGILFTGIGIFILKGGNEKIKNCTEKTEGTVIDIKEEWSTNSDGDYVYKYYPVIKYQVGRRTVTKQSSIGTSSNSKLSIRGGNTLLLSKLKYRLNDSVTVLYNPKNEEDFVIEGEENNYFIGGIIFIILGSLSAIFGIIKPVY